jgi:pre-mRNA-splicing factor 18
LLLQGIKRLMTVLQRLYPTDPSRAVDFNLTAPERQGQSDKAALLAAEAAGQRLALPAAPHHVANDGSIKIPEKWNVILQREIKAVEGSSGGGGGGGAKTPPRTPPRQQGGSPQKA